MNQLIRTLIVYACAALMLGLTIRVFALRGGPVWGIPETIFDHVWFDPPLSRQAIVMSRHAEALMPRGASVTVIAPELAPHYDPTHYLTASGLLPHHEVRHPALAEDEAWPDYVIALGKPLEHEGYRLAREFAEGRLYELKR
ncbi:MAG TPA: hypothetical protein VF701_21340 [Thermoanaerobaculia bacterium]